MARFFYAKSVISNLSYKDDNIVDIKYSLVYNVTTKYKRPKQW